MKNKGFTLVELLAVIVIMGIILLVAIPSVFGISKTVKDNMYCTKVRNIESAAKLYGNDYQDDFDDKGYIKVDVKTIIDNNLYKKETDDCVLGDNDKGCITDPRDESVMDNNTITIVKTGQRYYAYYDFINEEDIALCEGKKETDKFKHYDVALDGQGATYPGTTIVRDVIFGHEMPNIEAPRREYKVRLIDEYNHLDKTEIVKYTFRGYFAAKNGGVKYYDENGKNVHYYNLPEGRPLYAVWTDKSINLPKQTLTGYEFRGWFASRTGEDFIMESGNYTPTSDITLYARWIPKVSTITLDNQSATFKGTEKITATYNEAFPNITIPQKEYNVTLNYNGSGTPNTTLKSKNIFNGYWSQRNGKGTQYYNSTGKGIGVSKFTSNATIYASWKNGSITLPNPTRPGYKFTGWYTAASGGTKVGNAGEKYNASKNITLYAQWKEVDSLLKNGYDFREALRPFVEVHEKSYTSYDFSKIKNIVRSYDLPKDTTIVHLEDKASSVPILGWFINDTLYIYCESKIIYANPDSSRLFYDMGIVNFDMSIFDTSKVTDMSYMFYYCSDLTSINLSSMNTSKVTDMSYMFKENRSLTSLDLSSFDTSNVTNMKGMFNYTFKLTTLNINNMNTSRVTDMSYMFDSTAISSINVSSFNTSNVTNMSYMFQNTFKVSSLDLRNFNTSKVTDMSYMFSRTNASNLNLSSFDTSNVTDMSGMFYWAIYLKGLDIKHFNTSKVTNMSYMFGKCWYLTSFDISHFDTSNVTDMSGMFLDMIYLNRLDLYNFNTSKVTSMRAMFSGMNTIRSLDLSSFDTSNVTDMDAMFSYSTEIESLNLRSFNTSKVTRMIGMFASIDRLQELDLSSFDTRNVTEISGSLQVTPNERISVRDSEKERGIDYGLFFGDDHLRKIYVGNNWDLSKVNYSLGTFFGCDKLVGGAGTKYINNSYAWNASYAHVDGGPSNPGYLTRK